jgi:hypothetical protein
MIGGSFPINILYLKIQMFRFHKSDGPVLSKLNILNSIILNCCDSFVPDASRIICLHTLLLHPTDAYT